MPTLVHAANMSPIFGCAVTPVKTEPGQFAYSLNDKTYTIVGVALSLNVSVDEIARVKTCVEEVWKTKDNAMISFDRIAEAGETQSLKVY